MLRLAAMDYDASNFDSWVEVDLDRDNLLDLAFLHFYELEQALFDSAFSNVFVCEPKDALCFLGAFSYLVVRHATNTESHALSLDVG